MHATLSFRHLRKWTRRLALSLAASLATVSALSAQTDTLARKDTPLVPGERVRVFTAETRTSPARRHLADFGGWSNDTLMLTWDGRPWAAIPAGEITRLEVQRGRRSGVGRGALVGGLFGAGAGFILGTAAAAEPCDFVCYGAEVIPVSIAVLGAAGAGLGALIGAATPVRPWEEVPRASYRPALVSLGPGGVGVGVTVRF